MFKLLILLEFKWLFLAKYEILLNLKIHHENHKNRKSESQKNKTIDSWEILEGIEHLAVICKKCFKNRPEIIKYILDFEKHISDF